MAVYIDVVAILNFLVDLLLMIGTDRLCGFPMNWKRVIPAAIVGGVYAGVCLLPGFFFLANTLWRIVSLGIISWIAFGFSKSAIRRATVFVLLSMALGGIALGIGDGGFWSLAASAAGVSLLCAVGFRDRPGSVSYVPVELFYAGRRMCLTALHDTGNSLRDPVTGKPVLVVGAEIAGQLMGLTQQQLRSPVAAMADPPLPGLRLIPYRAVGQPAGMLLAIRLPQVRIGNWTGSHLVAFAPDGLSGEGAYQALTGGTL